MDAQRIRIAERCLQAADDGSLDFPTIVGTLMQAGFESYAVDYRRATTTYYLPDGDSIVLPHPEPALPVAARFQAASVQDAVREAQVNAPGYIYRGFCAKVTAAGCAGYVVSFLGRRVVYLGRTAETHVELFPQ